jgi:hypothetical protein
MIHAEAVFGYKVVTTELRTFLKQKSFCGLVYYTSVGYEPPSFLSSFYSLHIHFTAVNSVRN